MKKFWKTFKPILLSLLVMACWGSLYPFVKIGYKAFEINGTDVPSILMFAGTRFAVCGAVIFVVALVRRGKMQTPKKKTVGIILLIGLFSIVLNYAFAYIGLSTTDSSKTAIIKQLGVLLYICSAFLFLKNETFSIWKIVGAVTGFVGVLAINFSAKGISFSLGDILIVISSLCTVTASIFTKKIAKDNSPFWITGISQLFGGLVLMLTSVIIGGKMLRFDWYSLGVFAYICVASTTAYLLWNYVLKTTELSKMFLIKFAEPLFACLFSAILLGENIWQWQYLVAFALISTGIVLGNKSKKAKPNPVNNPSETLTETPPETPPETPKTEN